jgi:hypothetical protein
MVCGSMAKTKGLHYDGMKLFNILLVAVEETRNLNECKVIEEV